jgi:hypothetical protein
MPALTRGANRSGNTPSTTVPASSLVSASTKTVPSLFEPHWGGGWQMQEAGTVAVFVLGGQELVRATFVPTEDPSGAERGRAATHGVILEEAVAALTESGISEKAYDLARSSMLRLPTARRISVVNTNPGSPASWPFRRFIDPGRPGCVRCPVPASDRLTPEEDAAQIASLSGTPDLQARLGRGEWCGLLLGQPVVPNWNPAAHLARHRLEVVPYCETWVGWDSGGGAHCHATVIGQHVARHRIHILAALVSEDTGLEQHLAGVVLRGFSGGCPGSGRRRGARTSFIATIPAWSRTTAVMRRSAACGGWRRRWAGASTAGRRRTSGAA